MRFALLTSVVLWVIIVLAACSLTHKEDKKDSSEYTSFEKLDMEFDGDLYAPAEF